MKYKFYVSREMTTTKKEFRFLKRNDYQLEVNYYFLLGK